MSEQEQAQQAEEQAKGAAAETTEAKPARPRRSRARAQPAAEAAAPRPARRSRRTAAAPTRVRPRLEQRYYDEIRDTLIREFDYQSPMQAPAFEKVIVNMGLGEALTNGRALETAPEQLARITGQRPVITKARKSIAGFKVREGMSIGCMVTLRGRRMYEFLDRLLNVTLPRIRDFRGVPRTAFDGRGNYSLGLREQSIFPELEYGSIDRPRGMQVVIGTTARTDQEGFRLLELIGMPFAREGQGR